MGMYCDCNDELQTYINIRLIKTHSMKDTKIKLNILDLNNFLGLASY